MITTEQFISEQTGFDHGDLFETPEQVRAYFTVKAQREMFGEGSLWDEDPVGDQEQLDKLAELVIKHGWHMVKPDDAVEVAVISRALVEAGVAARCLDCLSRAGIAVWQTPGEGMAALRFSVRPDDYQRAIDGLEVGFPERFAL